MERCRSRQEVRRIRVGDKASPSCCARLTNGFFWLLCTARNAFVLLVWSVIVAVLVQQTEPGSWQHDVSITGNITSGLPEFKPPTFGTANVTFAEIVEDLGSTLFVVPLISILESVAIAKAFGTARLLCFCLFCFVLAASSFLFLSRWRKGQAQLLIHCPYGYH